MSSILLSNPVAAPPPQGTAAQDISVDAPGIPVTTVQQARDTKDTSNFGGSGTGSSNSRQGDTVAFMRARAGATISRPQDATPGSVINAQAQEDPSATLFGNNLPEVEMPDPIPTSPFLKRD
ncbi:MAG: hypothetical protein AAF755_03515 [Pseudomonadota bacterium]